MSEIDRLAPLMDRFRVRARLFHRGPLCGVTSFAAKPGRGFLHILRRGEMSISHRDPTGKLRHLEITRPSLLFYPRPLDHSFHNAPTEDSNFACASLEVAGNQPHPLLRTLPPVVVLPIDNVATLGPALDLLFSEVDQGLCGDGLLIDRLFDVVLVQLFRWMLDHATELGLPAGLFAGLSDGHLARALTAVHEHPGRPWTVETLALEAQMSRSAFAEHFAKTLGQTPADYVAEWRILVAQDLLRGGEPVGRVAMNVGYATTPAFSRAFARRVGMTPKAWAATAFANLHPSIERE